MSGSKQLLVGVAAILILAMILIRIKPPSLFDSDGRPKRLGCMNTSTETPMPLWTLFILAGLLGYNLAK